MNPKKVGSSGTYTATIQAAIPQTTLYSTIKRELLRFNYYVNARNSIGTGTFNVNVFYTDDNNSQTITIPLNVSGITQGSIILLGISGSNVSFSLDNSGFSTLPMFIYTVGLERIVGEY